MLVADNGRGRRLEVADQGDALPDGVDHLVGRELAGAEQEAEGDPVAVVAGAALGTGSVEQATALDHGAVEADEFVVGNVPPRPWRGHVGTLDRRGDGGGVVVDVEAHPMKADPLEGA